MQRTFSASHFLRGDFGEENLVHSHNYQVELRVLCPRLDENGFAADISLMEKVLETELARLDGTVLNKLDFFSSRQASLENLCVYLWKNVRSSGVVPKDAAGLELRIWEHEHAWASYAASPRETG